MGNLGSLLPNHVKGWVAYRALREVYRFTVDRDFRAGTLFQLTRPANCFQPYRTTETDRYPRVFQFARDQLGDNRQRRILSVGCSTGEEVFSLRRYFTAASIHGIDINHRNISICNKRLRRIGDAGLSFEVADSTHSVKSESCDAIFCMAVLRHGKLETIETPRCDHLIRFTDFDRVVRDFARCLKPGGLLFIWQSNFRFRDTVTSTQFEVVLEMERSGARIYDCNNQLMHGVDEREVGFRKRADARAGSCVEDVAGAS